MDEDHRFFSDFIVAKPEELYRLDWAWRHAGFAAGTPSSAFSIFVNFYDVNKALLYSVSPINSVLIGTFPSVYNYSVGSNFGGATANVWFPDRGWVDTIGQPNVRYAKVGWGVYNDNFAGSVYADVFVDRLIFAKSLVQLNVNRAGAARSIGGSTYTAPYFDVGVPKADNVEGFTTGNPGDHLYTVQKTGRYFLYARGSFGTMTNNKVLNCRILKNAAAFVQGAQREKTSGNSPVIDVSSGVVELLKGDTLKFQVYHEDAGANTLDTADNACVFLIEEVPESNQ